MAKAFASQGDLTEKKISFTEVGRDLWAFTAEGDPNTGVIIGDDSVMIVDAQATPRLAGRVIEKIRTVTDKPIKYVTLSHYHAVRVLGASAYGASEIFMSEKARSMVVERGQEDWDSEFGRFPRLVRDLARSLKKEINLELVGEETDLDKNLVEALADPLVHLVRNAVDHGIETPEEREAVGRSQGGFRTKSHLRVAGR